jgi:hypothetical protein
VETTVTTTDSVVSTTSTLIGPNGTAPGLSFIEQQSKPLEDSSGEGTAALPLLAGGIIFFVVFTTIFVRAWRRKQRRATKPSLDSASKQ